MSIATELTLLANSKQAIKNSINAKGGSITDSTPFADYSTAIDNLPSGGDDSALIDLIEGDITSINIPSGTTKIKSECFYNSTLASVSIPNTVTSIGNGTFSSTRLVSVTIPNSVTTIGGAAFQNCQLLTTATLPSGLRQISGNLFTDCRALTSITIPDTVTLIQSDAFSGCRALTSITIPSSVTSIGSTAFRKTTSATFVLCLPTTPPTLANYAFLEDSGCPIYVPAESVDAYKTAGNWSTYASRIYPITQLATVDGNPVYNYEIGNKDATTILSTEMDKLPTGTSIEFAEGITNMGGSISGYTTVTLPSTFTTFNDQDMIGSSVTTLTMKSTTPPTAERNKFGGSGLTTIYVPASAVDTYKADSGWSSFASIIQAIPVQAKLTITLQDDSIYVEPSDGATTLNNEVLINLADAGEIDTSVKKIEVGEMITELEDMYYDDDPSTICGTFDMMSMSELVLPASLTAMGENTFANGGVSSSITCYAVTPPTFTGHLPGTPRIHPTVYVPAESVEAYQTAWSKYASWIQAIPTE